MKKPREFWIKKETWPGDLDIVLLTNPKNRRDLNEDDFFHVIEKSAADKLADVLDFNIRCFDEITRNNNIDCSADKYNSEQSLKEYRGSND